MLDPLLFHPALEKDDLEFSIIDFTLPSIVAKKTVNELLAYEYFHLTKNQPDITACLCSRGKSLIIITQAV